MNNQSCNATILTRNNRTEVLKATPFANQFGDDTDAYAKWLLSSVKRSFSFIAQMKQLPIDATITCQAHKEACPYNRLVSARKWLTTEKAAIIINAAEATQATKRESAVKIHFISNPVKRAIQHEAVTEKFWNAQHTLLRQEVGDTPDAEVERNYASWAAQGEDAEAADRGSITSSDFSRQMARNAPKNELETAIAALLGRADQVIRECSIRDCDQNVKSKFDEELPMCGAHKALLGIK